MADGSQLIGAAWIKDIKTVKDGQRYTITYRQDELDKLGQAFAGQGWRVSSCKPPTRWNMA